MLYKGQVPIGMVDGKTFSSEQILVENKNSNITVVKQAIKPLTGLLCWSVQRHPVTNEKTLFLGGVYTETCCNIIYQDPNTPITTYPWNSEMSTIDDIYFESPIRPYHLTNFLVFPDGQRSSKWEGKTLKLEIECDQARDAENAINIPEVANAYIEKLIWNDCDWKSLQTIPTNLISARWAIRDFEHYNWKVYNNNFFTNCLKWLAYSPVQSPGVWDHPQILDTRTIQLQPNSVITQYTALNYDSGQRVTAPSYLILNKDICDHVTDLKGFCHNWGVNEPGTCDVQHIYLEKDTLMGQGLGDVDIAYYDEWGQSIVSCWCGPWLVRNPNDPSWDQWRWPWFCYPRGDSFNSHNVRGYLWTQYSNRYCYSFGRDSYWDLPTWGAANFHLFEQIPDSLKDYYIKPEERS